MHYQHRNRDLLEIFGEICLRERHNSVVMRLCATLHSLPPPVTYRRLQWLHAWPVETIKGPRCHIQIELRAISGQLSLEPIEHFLWKPAGVCLCFHHQRWTRADQRRLGHATLSVAGQIVSYLSAS